MPNDRSSNAPTFNSLKSNQKGVLEFESGMAAYKLQFVWDAVVAKNAWNCAELKHGLPFFRLARFGFMAQPTAKDLAGILNTNAMYSFCTGVTQLVLGAIYFWTYGFSFYTVLPLSITVFSLC